MGKGTVLCVFVLFTSAAVHCLPSAQSCIYYGIDCDSFTPYSTGGGGGGGGWLAALQQQANADRASPEQGKLSVKQLQVVKMYLCDCCCMEAECEHSQFCGTTHSCPISDCYAQILGKLCAKC